MNWNSNDFPMLTAEETAECFRRAREGDAAARERLIVGNMRLVLYVAGKFKSFSADLDDAISAGAIGLIKAVDNFDISQTNFPSYAQSCIYRDILSSYYRREVKHRDVISLDEPLSAEDEACEASWYDIIASDTDVEAGADLKFDLVTLEKALDVLDDDEREFIEKRFGLIDGICHSQRSLAPKYGKSRTWAVKFERDILSKMRRVFAGKVVR